MERYTISTEEIGKRIEELEEQRRIISAETRRLKRIIWQRERFKPSKNTNTLVYKTFGKSVKELTIEEKKKYNAIRQQKVRDRKTAEKGGLKYI